MSRRYVKIGRSTNPSSQLRGLDIATGLQGATAGLSMSLVAFLLAEESIILAGVMSAAVALGMISSRFLKGIRPRTMSLLMTVARTLAVFAAYKEAYFISIVCAAVAGLASRRLLLDLKHQVGYINPRHLAKHAIVNSLLFGVGAGIAGIALSTPVFAQVVAFLVAVAAFLTYPYKGNQDVGEASGLTRRDVIAATVFTFASAPLTNSIAPVLLIGIVGSGVAGLSCLFFTLGSLFAPRMADVLLRYPKPVALTTALASITFASGIFYPEPLIIYLTRFVAGTLLYVGQGILEIRTQREGDGKGLEYLWSLISAAAVIANIAVPWGVELTSVWMAPLWTLIGAFIIFNLSRIPTLR
jgi:hypothetical protein